MRSRSATLLLLALLGCGDPAPTQPSDDGCDVPAPAQWVSTTLEECGLGPPADAGPSVGMCHWVIALAADGSGTWSHSDVVESVTTECDHTTLSVTAAGQPAKHATYDATSGWLSFDGVAYCKSGAADCPPGGD